MSSRYTTAIMWWNKKKTCAYWDCDSRAVDGQALCADHQEKRLLGLIDRCPKCGRFKDIMYYLCQDCYVGRKVKSEKKPPSAPEPKQKRGVKYSDAWTDGSASVNRRYVYIIGSDDGHMSVGQTKDISSRLSELKEPQNSVIRLNARLDYLEMAVDEKAAELRVAELKELVRINPEQIGMMIFEFHHHMRELGFEKD